MADRDRAAAAALTGTRTTAVAVDAHSAATDAARELVALVSEVADRVGRSDHRGCAFQNYLTEFPGEEDQPAGIARAYLRNTRRQIDERVAVLGAPPLIADRLWLLIDALYAGTGTPPRVAVDWARELVTTAAPAAAEGRRPATRPVGAAR